MKKVNNSNNSNNNPGNSGANSKSNIIGDYSILQTLGKGTFGKVKLGIYLPAKEKVAVKILEKSKLVEKDDYKRVMREMEIIKHFNHENVIQVFEILEDRDKYYIITEYCEEGELFNYIVKRRRLSEDETACFFYQIINGLENIHSFNVAHRDLKPENLLLNKEKKLKIIDFGLSNFFKDRNADQDSEDDKDGDKESFIKYNLSLATPCGSPCYASPEMVSGYKYNGFKIDVWSSGVILFAMICGYLPFEDSDNDKLFIKIQQCHLTFPNHVPSQVKNLIKRILVSDPEKRITIPEIKKHSLYLHGQSIYNAKYNKGGNINSGKINSESTEPTSKPNSNPVSNFNSHTNLNFNNFMHNINHSLSPKAKKSKGREGLNYLPTEMSGYEVLNTVGNFNPRVGIEEEAEAKSTNNSTTRASLNLNFNRHYNLNHNLVSPKNTYSNTAEKKSTRFFKNRIKKDSFISGSLDLNPVNNNVPAKNLRLMSPNNNIETKSIAKKVTYTNLDNLRDITKNKYLPTINKISSPKISRKLNNISRGASSIASGSNFYLATEGNEYTKDREKEIKYSAISNLGKKLRLSEHLNTDFISATMNQNTKVNFNFSKGTKIINTSGYNKLFNFKNNNHIETSARSKFNLNKLTSYPHKNSNLITNNSNGFAFFNPRTPHNINNSTFTRIKEKVKDLYYKEYISKVGI